MTTIGPTRITVNPSDSALMTLARAALSPQANAGEASWPQLDLNDPKQRAFGDYELLEEIGRGGMGVVYRARQHSLDREVAIKFIAAGIADGVNVARFLAEARAAARLMHPNIVPVHEVGSIDGVHYFSMPLIKGRTLAVAFEGSVWQANTVIALMLKLCDAIDYAHRLGLLHLDLKPANVMIDERGEPLITDFGLARHMDANQGVDTQEVSGTPSFMAPEQILIKQYRLTPATDIYALGAILYCALTGVSPHGIGQPDELTQRAIAGRVRPIRELNRAVSPDLSSVAMKCLELLPKDRYPKVAHLADDLRRIRDGLPVSVRRPGVLERLRRWGKKPEAAVLMMLIAAVVGTGKGMYKAQAAEQLASASQAQALKERDVARATSELGAWLYAQSFAPTQNQSLDLRMLGWLQSHYPENHAEQAKALTAFTSALASESPEAANSLIWPLIGVMGGNYRKDVVTALEAGNEPDRHALAARLAWFDERLLLDAPTFAALLDRALVEQPDALAVWAMAATFCTGPAGAARCHHPEAIERLIELDPDNAFHWLLRANSEQGERGMQALHEAASRSRFDDHFRQTFAGYRDAILKGKAPLPALIAGPANVVAPLQRPEFLVVLAESAPFPITDWQPLMRRCDPARPISAQVRTDCLAIGMLMAESKATLVTRHIGGLIVRRLSRGQPLEQQMIAKARQWFYIRDSTLGQLTPKQIMGYGAEELVNDIAEQGEMEAWAKRLTESPRFQ